MHGLRVAECSRPHSTTLVLQSVDSAEWATGISSLIKVVAGDTDGCDGCRADGSRCLVTLPASVICFAQIQDRCYARVLLFQFDDAWQRLEGVGASARSVGGGSYVSLSCRCSCKRAR